MRWWKSPPSHISARSNPLHLRLFSPVKASAGDMPEGATGSFMHYDIHGSRSADAPVILLSSGLGGSGAYWAPQLEALGKDYRIVTYDHRGCGRTGGEVPADGGIRAMADDILEIVDELKLERFHFIGHAL